MKKMQRRSFLELALATLPLPLFGQELFGQDSPTPSAIKPVHVKAGADREARHHAIGVSATTYKVLTQDTGGALFVMEQSNHTKGGPTQHLHHAEDELFYALAGDYVVEVGPDRFFLKAGDCVLGPKGIPHAWAFIGNSPGRLLISFAPAGKMEAFFNERERAGYKQGTYATGKDGAALMHAYGMELTGPAFALDKFI